MFVALGVRVQERVMGEGTCAGVCECERGWALMRVEETLGDGVWVVCVRGLPAQHG